MTRPVAGENFALGLRLNYLPSLPLGSSVTQAICFWDADGIHSAP